MSPSMMPTRLPSFASAMARLTATVVLPTPPLPAPTAMMLRMPGIGARPPPGATADRTAAVMSTSTDVTPATPPIAAAAWLRSCSFTGHAGVVSSIVTATAPPSMATRFTKPRLTMSLWRSGSWTTRRASRTAASVTAGAREDMPAFYRAGPRSRAVRRPDLLLGDFPDVGQLEAFALEGAEHAVEPEEQEAEG